MGWDMVGFAVAACVVWAMWLRIVTICEQQADRIVRACEQRATATQHFGQVIQPDPIPTDARPVWELVVEDMHARDRVGRERYGTPLQAGNGRDALQDAYEEALDLAVYLKQALIERGEM